MYKTIEEKEQRIAELEADRDRIKKLAGNLVQAVEHLPVTDWVQPDQFGKPEFLGYLIQAQGDWDAFRVAMSELVWAMKAEGKYDTNSKA